MDHPAAHRDPVLLGDVAAEADEVEGGEAPHGHGQVDAPARDVLQVPDVCNKDCMVTLEHAKDKFCSRGSIQ